MDLNFHVNQVIFCFFFFKKKELYCEQEEIGPVRGPGLKGGRGRQGSCGFSADLMASASSSG
jgi:hypothetical protein